MSDYNSIKQLYEDFIHRTAAAHLLKEIHVMQLKPAEGYNALALALVNLVVQMRKPGQDVTAVKEDMLSHLDSLFDAILDSQLKAGEK